MKLRNLWLAALVWFAVGVAPAADSARPNIVIILADDLGYGDLSCYGHPTIRTPNLDRMAAEGMRFTHHYSGNAVCAPSRCVLMTGQHPGHAFIRDNRQFKPNEEGQYPIPADTVTLAKLFQQRGYATGGYTWSFLTNNSGGKLTAAGAYTAGTNGGLNGVLDTVNIADKLGNTATGTITAGTYATVGAATPARVGLSAVKAARRTGRSK